MIQDQEAFICTVIRFEAIDKLIFAKCTGADGNGSNAEAASEQARRFVGVT